MGVPVQELPAASSGCVRRAAGLPCSWQTCWSDAAVVACGSPATRLFWRRCCSSRDPPARHEPAPCHGDIVESCTRSRQGDSPRSMSSNQGMGGARECGLLIGMLTATPPPMSSHEQGFGVSSLSSLRDAALCSLLDCLGGSFVSSCAAIDVFRILYSFTALDEHFSRSDLIRTRNYAERAALRRGRAANPAFERGVLTSDFRMCCRASFTVFCPPA